MYQRIIFPMLKREVNIPGNLNYQYKYNGVKESKSVKTSWEFKDKIRESLG
ncbi:hypothetical protein RHF61_12670 [Clostridioides difficile]|nr:hypothetical protein [Clostridioides difficile]